MPLRRQKPQPTIEGGYVVHIIKHPTLRRFGLFRGGFSTVWHRFFRGDIKFVGAVNTNTKKAYISLGKTFHGNLAEQLIRNGLPSETRDAWINRKREPSKEWRFFSGGYDPRTFAAEQDFGMDQREWHVLQEAVKRIHGRKAGTLMEHEY
ncbi:hypothetical protein KJ765_02335 [Candidatus Micrarchaeota archaeon]|nr:hypothetical protein [Candidatus Micrarchaeota archaeon]